MTSQSNAPTAEQPAGPSTATCWFLLVATLTGATLFILGLFDLATVWELPRGMSGFLAATMAIAGIGAIVRIAADGVNRRLDRQHDELAEQAARQRQVTYMPSVPRVYQGQRHLSAAVGDTVPSQQRIGLDADTIAAARSLARQLVDGPAEQPNGS